MRPQHALTAGLIVCLFACSEESIPFGDQSGMSGRVNPKELLGALHATLGENWSDFDRALATVDPWTGGHKQRRCTNMLACGLGFSKDTVEIQANPESMFVNSTTVGTYGTILMKLANKGKRPTGEYGLNPPPSVYYVVVKSTAPKTYQWALVETGGIAPARLAGGWQPFNECEPPHIPKKSTANFQKCHDPEPSQLQRASLSDFAGFGSSLIGSAIQLLFALESPAWISCAYGCCTLAEA